MLRTDVGTVPGEKRDNSLLTSVLLVAIFLCLAIIGSYVLLNMPRSLPGNVDTQSASAGYGATFFIDGVPPENLSEPHYAQNGTLSGTWRYYADSDPSADVGCLIFSLVDYNLTPLRYDGNLSASYAIRNLTSFTRNVSYTLTGLQEGFHDVTLFAITDPYIEAANKGPISGSPGTGWAVRYNVIAGNASKPEIAYGSGPLEKYVTYQDGSPYNVMGYGPWMTAVPCADMVTITGAPSDNASSTLTASPGQPLDYYINVKNGAGDTNERYGRFALLQLLDYGKVPLQLDSTEYVYYGALGPNRVMALHASLKAPSTPGTHVLSLVLAGYPYENNTPERYIYMVTGITPIVLYVKG